MLHIACWVEFDSDGLGTSGAKVDMTLSENRLPGEVHNLQPKVYNTTDYATYRLEPNNQLYEGVRYVFINVTAAGNAQWTLQNLRRVCQVVPTNYDGSFDSSDDVLNRIWWTGAYTARVTMVGNGLHSTNAGYLGSELKDRGDRIAFLGTQPTQLPLSLVRHVTSQHLYTAHTLHLIHVAKADDNYVHTPQVTLMRHSLQFSQRLETTDCCGIVTSTQRTLETGSSRIG